MSHTKSKVEKKSAAGITIVVQQMPAPSSYMIHPLLASCIAVFTQ
jgi:hypothetical protein